jgi:uncharacterized membrane protein
MNHKPHPPTGLCPVCGKSRAASQLVPGILIRPAIRELIRRENPDWADESVICRDDLNNYRAQYVRETLEASRGATTTLDEQVMKSISDDDVLTRNINAEFERKLSFGDRLSDRFSDVAGSWGFIVGFCCVLMLWVVINTVALVAKPFDPYPFIFLNLLLSCIAAIQAPLIMMSQNRQENKDRIHAEHDYLVNLKAEIEIRSLHQKIDHLLEIQWTRLLEIQEIQTELMQEVIGKKRFADRSEAKGTGN